jgi:ABC-type metal ion transport system substrate-binding protein
MKKYFTPILLVFAFIQMFSPAVKAQEQFEKIEIIITRKTSKEDLEKIIAVMGEEKGIDIKIEEVKYSSKGNVLNIKGEINCNDGKSGSFEVVRLKKLHIIRDYNPQAEIPFEIRINK